MSTRILILWVLAVSLAAGWQARAAAEGEGTKDLEIVRFDTPPRIDGKLDDPAWDKAAVADGFTVLASGAAPVALTEAKVGADGRWLYLGIRCEEDTPENLVRRITMRDGPVNADDSLEIFLDPGTDGETYFHFKVSVGNVQADQRVKHGRTHPDWNAGWQSAVYVDPDVMAARGWSVEMALPLYVLRREAGPGEWRLNICRNKRSKPSEYTAWSPVKAGFHEPGRFGRVLGLKDIKAEDLFAPLLLSSRVGPYRAEGSGYAYSVHGEVMNDGGLAGRTRLVVNDRPAEGATTTVTEVLDLGPLEKTSYVVRVPVAQPGGRNITITLRDAETGEVMQQSGVSGLDALNPMSVFLDRNYYTTERVARLHAAVDSLSGGGSGRALKVTATISDAAGRRLVAQAERVRAGKATVRLPLSKLPQGRHKLSVELADTQGAVLGVTGLTLIKHPSAPEEANEVKLDHEHRCLLLNGKPFFPVGICQMRMDDPTMAFCAEAGFNTIIRWWGPARGVDVSRALDTLDLAAKHGIMMIDRPLCFTRERRQRGELFGDPELFSDVVTELEPFFKAARYHPALLAHYGLDEAPSGRLDVPLRKFLDRAHALDPYHPVYISGGTAVHNARYDFADILGVHIYWCAMGFQGGKDNPNVMAKGVRRFYGHLTEEYHRPLFVMPQAEITSATRRPRTPRERRVDVYLAVIHGAKSIIYFSSPIRHRLSFENMKTLSRELHAMAPALLRKRPAQDMRVTPAPTGNDLPVVQALLASRPEGGGLLVAANSKPVPVTVDWDLSMLGRAVRLSDLFEDTAVKLTAGRFRDRMEGYATRAFRVSGWSADRQQGEAVIGLTLSGAAVEHKGAAEPAPRSPVVNLIDNGGFEQQTAGWKVPEEGVLVADSPGREGRRCLLVDKTGDEEPVRVSWVRRLELKPATRYRYGGWVNTDAVQGRMGGSFYVNEEGGQKRVRTGLPFSLTHGTWQHVSRVFRTPADHGVNVNFWFLLPPGFVGTCKLDDVFLDELPEEKVAAQPQNLLFNSSFERATLPGWPDSWWINGTYADSLIGDPGATGLDSTTAVHGKACLRIHNPFDTRSGLCNATYRHEFASQGLRGGIPAVVGKTYVLSAYLKSPQEGTPVDMVLCNFSFNAPRANEGTTTTIELGTEWKRYTARVTYPAEGWSKGIRPELAVLFRHKGDGHTSILIDAVQLEEGPEPTNYTPREAE